MTTPINIIINGDVNIEQLIININEANKAKPEAPNCYHKARYSSGFKVEPFVVDIYDGLQDAFGGKPKTVDGELVAAAIAELRVWIDKFNLCWKTDRVQAWAMLSKAYVDSVWHRRTGVLYDPYSKDGRPVSGVYPTYINAMRVTLYAFSAILRKVDAWKRLTPVDLSGFVLSDCDIWNTTTAIGVHSTPLCGNGFQSDRQTYAFLQDFNIQIPVLPHAVEYAAFSFDYTLSSFMRANQERNAREKLVQALMLKYEEHAEALRKLSHKLLIKAMRARTVSSSRKYVEAALNHNELAEQLTAFALSSAVALSNVNH